MANQITNFVKIEREEIIEQINDIIKQKEAWKDVYDSDTGQVFVQIGATPGDLTMYYVQRAKAETYISTAKLKSSVVNIVKVLNYTPSRKTSSYGDLEFVLEEALTNTVIIPAKTIILAGNSLQYVTTLDVTIPAGSLSVTVEAIQGEWITESFSSNGNANQTYLIDDTGVENSNLTITNDGTTWEATSSFTESQFDSKEYVVVATLDDQVKIEFGDGVNGAIPLSGTPVEIEYLKSDGVDGNVDSLGYLNAIDSEIFDVAGNSVTTLSVSNTTKFLGGSDEEDIEEIRFNAPQVFKTGDRAVNNSDHQAILQAFPGIKSAKVWGERDETPPNILMNCIVRISMMLDGWDLADDNFKDFIANFFYDEKSMITVTYMFDDPTLIDVVAIDNVSTTTSFGLSAVTALVEAKIDNVFELGDTYDSDGERVGGVNVGEAVRFSNVDRQIDSVDGVSHHSLSLQGFQLIGTGDDIETNFTDTLYLTSVTKESVLILNGGTVIAQDDGLGVISGTGVVGTVNYTTGIIDVTFSVAPITDNEIRVQYQPRYSDEQPNDLVPSKNQIIKLEEKRVTVNYG